MQLEHMKVEASESELISQKDYLNSKFESS
jgi:hypothetical protein